MNKEEIMKEIEHIANCELYDTISVKYIKNNIEKIFEENKQLIDIIDELEKWLKENIGICRLNINYTTNQIFNLKEDTYYRCLNKLKSLKEGK